MFRTFSGSSADSVWQDIAESFRTGEFSADQQSRAGLTSEILHATVCISNPRQRWVASRRPALNVAFALVETVWILRGRNDSAFLNYFNRQLPKYAGTGSTYHGAYGYRLRKLFGLDQLERAYSVLKNNPETRQAVLQLWHPPSDSPDPEGRPADRDIPCNTISLLKVRGGRLEWLQVLRSNDVYRGLPYNFVQFTTLQEVIAGWLGLDLGDYHHVSDSLHVYGDTAAHLRSSLPVVVKENTDNLAVPKAISDCAFRKLEQLVEMAITDEASPKELVGICEDSVLPASYRNIARVICSEALRRHEHPELAKQVMAKCSNAAFKELYAAWAARVESRLPQARI